MKIDIQTSNYNVSDKLKGLITKKIERLNKFFDKDVKVKVVLARKNDREKMEINVSSGSLYIRSEVETDNMYSNLDLCIAKIEKQIIKYSGKNLAKKKQQLLEDFDFFDTVPEFKLPQITKRKVYDLTPMTEKDALIQMDLVDNDFFIFMNKKVNKVCLLYKRKDGDVGLIETN